MERIEKIKEIRKLCINKLNIKELLNQEDFIKFCAKFTSILTYSRTTNLLNLSIEEINNILDNAINFFNNIGLNKLDLINILGNNISILDIIYDKDFLNKYILLSIGENDINNARINLLLKKPETFKKSINEIYARYKILEKANRKITINSLIIEDYLIFINRFIPNTYLYNESKILNRKIPLEELEKTYPINYTLIDKLKESDINKNVTFTKNNDLTPDEKRLLAIKNYKKVNNLGELSLLLDISTSSLQRYLNEDSRRFVNEKEYLDIKMWLKNAKKEGLKTGGTNSQALYGYLKDESGKFNGIKK